MLAIDHIVIAAKNPEKAAERFAQDHGVTITEGGKHTSWGTYNYLAFFRNDCYIEWLGIFDEATAARADNPLVHLLFQRLAEGQEGPIQYALRTQDMDDAVENLKQAGMPYTGPIPGSRSRPDGSLLEWQMLFPEAEMEILPFLIEWSDGSNTPEDSGLINNKTIRKLAVPVTDLNTFSAIYQITFNDHIAHLENADLQHSKDVRYIIT
ncbi:hypothetical protein GCM10028778_25640 [Barrientosiimonas marina]|uniref:VOC family protein n=1 Tax=Lentibacillus kimchii TaxID=1542911 RepID=A0ABW2USL4_9BACI